MSFYLNKTRSTFLVGEPYHDYWEDVFHNGVQALANAAAHLEHADQPFSIDYVRPVSLGGSQAIGLLPSYMSDPLLDSLTFETSKLLATHRAECDTGGIGVGEGLFAPNV